VCVCADEVFALRPASRDLTLPAQKTIFFARVLACMGRGRTVRVVYLPLCGDLPAGELFCFSSSWLVSIGACSAWQSTARELFLTTGRSSAMIVVSHVWPVHVHVGVEPISPFFFCVLHLLAVFTTENWSHINCALSCVAVWFRHLVLLEFSCSGRFRME
jgi:hypothetical protein